MNSQQYEELCRYFLAEKLGINVDQIEYIRILNPTRPGCRITNMKSIYIGKQKAN